MKSRNNERPEPRTIDEILAPVRKQFVESGMTEEELDVLIDEAREEVWQEEHTQESSS